MNLTNEKIKAIEELTGLTYQPQHKYDDGEAMFCKENFDKDWLGNWGEYTLYLIDKNNISGTLETVMNSYEYIPIKWLKSLAKILESKK